MSGKSIEIVCCNCVHFELGNEMPQTVKNKIETVFWDEEGNPKNISEQTAVVFMGISASGYGTRRCGPNPGLRGSTFGISPCIAPEDFEVKSKDQLPD